MLKAHWHGYEIDSSEAAYEAYVSQTEKPGALVRGLLSTDYFVHSYYLVFEEPLTRLRDFIAEQGETEDELTAKTMEYLEKQIAKFDPSSHKAIRIGVRAIETILDYVGAHRQELLEAETFRFELTEWQKEMWEDYGYDEDEEFVPGSLVDEEIYYSEEEIPFDGVVLYLSCSLVAADKLTASERNKAYKLVRQNYERFDLPADYAENDMSRRQNLSLRVRLNPDATFTITGRWMDDGQFILPYYDYLLGLAAKKAGVELGIYSL